MFSQINSTMLFMRCDSSFSGGDCHAWKDYCCTFVVLWDENFGKLRTPLDEKLRDVVEPLRRGKDEELLENYQEIMSEREKYVEIIAKNSYLYINL